MPYGIDRPLLSERLTAYYRDVIAVHEDDPVVGACLICRVSCCEDWRSAAERLGYADELPTRRPAAEASHRSDSREPGAPGITPVRAGDIVQVTDGDNSYGLTSPTLRVTSVHGLVYLDDGPWVILDGIPLWPDGDEGDECYAQVRVVSIRLLSEWPPSRDAS
jgi:hypothetical protein